MKRIFFIAASFVIATVAVAITTPVAIRRMERNQAIAERKDIVLPPPIRLEPISSSAVSSSFASVSPSIISAAVNWDVPFTSQAPTGIWDSDHKEACEEASVLMVLRYFEGRRFASIEDADSAVIGLVRANEALGNAVDISAAQVIDLLRSQNPVLNTRLLIDPSVNDMKKILSDGELIIVPVQGQLLGNPYFQHPGPPYHMLVVRGFTDTGFVITNDPGTKRGEAFVYTWDVLMNAMHDWNGGDVESGAKRVIFVGRDLFEIR